MYYTYVVVGGKANFVKTALAATLLIEGPIIEEPIVEEPVVEEPVVEEPVVEPEKQYVIPRVGLGRPLEWWPHKAWVIFSCRAKLSKEAQEFAQLEKKEHVHGYAVRPTATLRLSGRSDIAPANHTHNYPKERTIVLEDVAMFQGASSDYFALRGHKHHYIERRTEVLRLLAPAPRGSSVLLVDKRPSHTVYACGKILVWVYDVAKEKDGWLVYLFRPLEERLEAGSTLSAVFLVDKAKSMEGA